MEKRRLGRTDMEVGVLGFGGAEIGFEGAGEETVRTLLNEALDSGLNVIDTGECYVNSEELIGKSVASRRKEYYLFTKCGHPEGLGSEDWTPSSLTKSIERSLVRLRTDYLDLVFLHSCSEAVLREGAAIAALQHVRERGLVRYIGYSGDSNAALYAIQCGALDVLETSLSIADQEAIDLTLPPAREQNMGVVIKRPIANAAWRTGQKPANSYHHVYWERLQRLEYDSLKGDLKRAVAIALRFTFSVPGVHMMIVGTTKPGRWKENLAILDDGPLPREEFERIRARWREVADETWTGQV
ncbi:MAG: aldo/keto reductase [Candidatus Hydrogenedentes bacterium]|nr:aldo/keto reductase [Candidatus Hydrogenedentota bacterium]